MFSSILTKIPRTHESCRTYLSKNISTAIHSTKMMNLIDLYNYILGVIKPEVIFRDKIKFSENFLLVRDIDESCHKFDISQSKILVVGAGKCALKMAESFSEIYNSYFIDKDLRQSELSGVIVTIDDDTVKDTGSDNHFSICDLEVYRVAKRNKPDAKSVVATDAIFDYIDKSKKIDDHLDKIYIVFLSGGGSSCLVSPRHISLEEKQKLITFVKERKGIKDLNAVRRYFSNVKGGRLAAKILENSTKAKIITIIISDVVGDPIEYISSGPTYVDNNSTITPKLQRENMIKVLKECNYPLIEKLISKCPFDEEEIKLQDSSINNLIICNNNTALRAAVEYVERNDWTCISLGDKIECSCSSYIQQVFDARDKHFAVSSKPCVIIGGGEVTLDIEPGDKFGVGGRAQELAMQYLYAAMSEINNRHKFKDEFLAASSDGQDGPTNVGACLVSYSGWQKLPEKKYHRHHLEIALREHDSYNFWRDKRFSNDYSPLIYSHLTGSNVMDVYIAKFKLENKS